MIEPLIEAAASLTGLREKLAGEARQDERHLEEAAKAFESMLVQLLVREMREAQLEKGFFGEAPGSETYQAMFEQQLADRLSEESPFGIARALLDQWKQDDEGALEAGEAIQRGRALDLYRAVSEALPAQVSFHATDTENRTSETSSE